MIVLHDFARPLAERAKSRKVCGPYRWTPTKPGSGRGFYMECGRSLRMARHGSGMQLRVVEVTRRGSQWSHEFGDTFQAIVLRLPRSRGFLAGWTLGAGMCASVDSTIYDDADDASRAACDEAERACDRDYWFQVEERERLDQEEAEQAQAEAIADYLADHRPDLAPAYA